ncbi:MAG: DUF3574 domain-containing protein [Pseudomonadota bacterium]
MKNNLLLRYSGCLLAYLLLNPYAAADPVNVQMFFGLVKPGGTPISQQEWKAFEENTLASTFPGFTVVDAVGYYQHHSLPSKLVILVIDDDDLSKAEWVASIYSEHFEQESVMLTTTPLLSWKFVGAPSTKPQKHN